MSEELGIVGTGAFATALAQVVGARGRQVMLYTRSVEKARELNQRPSSGVRATSSPEALAAAARLIIIAVRSDRIHGELAALGDALHGGHLVVHASGGLLPDVGRVSRLIQRETCVKRIGAVAGPALAKDLAEGRPSALVVASAYDEVMLVAQRALQAQPALRVYRRRDLVGVELAAALSGVMTMAVGIADGMGLGAGPRALLITRAVAEMVRFGVASGAGEGAFTGLAGLGNLLVRSQASSERSEDYLLGRAFVKGGERRLSEGAQAAAELERMARKVGARTPLLDAVVAVLGGATPSDVMARLTDTDAPEE